MKWSLLVLAFFSREKKEGNKLLTLTNTNFIPANGEVGYQWQRQQTVTVLQIVG